MTTHAPSRRPSRCGTGRNAGGFTLVEILIAVAAMSILASVVIFAINPSRQLGAARNTRRQSDVASIAHALFQYTTDHDGALPAGIDTTPRVLGTASSGCQVSCGNMVPTTPVGGGTTTTSTTVTYTVDDAAKSSFDRGTYASTQFDSLANVLALNTGSTSGTYTSAIRDSGSTETTWKSFSWTPLQPYGKELPSNQQKESGYAAGNVDMTGNVLLMHFNETAGTTAYGDASGNGNAGACSVHDAAYGCPVMGGTGLFNTGVTFSGTTTYVSVPDSPSLEFPNLNFTLSTWVKTNGTGGAIMSKPWNGGGQYNYTLTFNNGTPQFYVQGLNAAGTFTGFTLGASATIPLNTWTHVVATMDNTGMMTIYLNGVQVASRASGILSSTATNDHRPLAIARNFPYTSGANTGAWFDGSIDEVAIFNRVLSATDVTALYRRGANQLRFQVRSCTDATCSSVTFKGPDGTANTSYSDGANASLTPSSFTLSNVANARYFQYKALFSTLNTSLVPQVNKVTASGTFPQVTGVSTETASTVFTDATKAQFDQGTYATNTQYNALAGDVELNAGQTTGVYMSAVRDSGDTKTSWSDFSWAPSQPTGKELPNSGQKETGYAAGGADMTGNVMLMHLNEAVGATTFLDSSGSANHGSCSGTACPQMGGAGLLNGGAVLNGNQNWISVPATSSLNFGSSTNFTLSAWVKANSLANNPFLLGTRSSWGGANGGYTLLLNPSGIPQLRVGNGTVANAYGPTTSASYGLNMWHHYVVTADRASNIATFYADGTNLGTVSISTAGNIANAENVFRIGTKDGTAANALNGAMDEIAVFSRALSAGEVSALYRRGAVNERFQVRSCSDAACGTGTFVGPDGTASTYFSEISNNTMTPPSFALTTVPAGRYLQYKALFDSVSSSIVPKLLQVSVGGSAPKSSAPSASLTNAITDATKDQFDQGVYQSNTSFDTTTNRLAMNLGTGSGTYVSSVHDSGNGTTTWGGIAWTPSRPMGKELPGSQQKENGYPTGNADMSSNTMLMHLNEAAGAMSFADASNNGLYGTCVAGRCPTVGGPGKFNTAATFDGANSYINLGNAFTDATYLSTMTVEAWIKTSTVTSARLPIVAKQQFSSVSNHMFVLALNNGNPLFTVTGLNTSGAATDYTAVSSSAINDGAWHHVAGVWDGSSKTVTLYVDGGTGPAGKTVSTSGPSTGLLLNVSTNAYVGSIDNAVQGNLNGHTFSGSIDEAAVYKSALSATAIRDHYLRGVLQAKFQVRSCADTTCSSANFVGPDGTANTYFTEATNQTASTPALSVAGVSPNRYVQYQTMLSSSDLGAVPQIAQVSLGGSVPGSVPTSTATLIFPTTDACLDMSSSLVSGGYLTELPRDPRFGTSDKSFYAVSQDEKGVVTVTACGVENSAVVQSKF